MESLIGWRNKHTAGMVLTLSSVMDLGAWTVKYDDLRRRLGFIKPVLITDSNAKGSTSMYAEKDFGYANFSDMKRRVLDPVMNEVNKGCEEGRAVPFYFEYEPNYMDGKTRGIPKSITFKMHKSDFGRMMKAENERSKEKTEIREFLIKNLKIGKTSAAALSSLINDDNKVGFRKKMEELYGFISDPKNTIKDVGAYCVVALKNWVESNEPVLDKTPTVDAEYEVVSDAAPAQQAQQAPKADTLEERWGRVMAGFRTQITVQEWRQSFDYSNALRPLRFDEGSITLGVSDKHYYNDFMERFFERLRPLIYQEFGLVGIYFEQFK